ncbi:NACHT, LRR and PYD domains-containing protein 10-like [Centruroides vittatus]|uniref:NACHT, LRR and PYD domains-containing protein 10-like n=1 Tax=Centruroides vittatus TaxID=120091 RepID=UPI00350EE79B
MKCRDNMMEFYKKRYACVDSWLSSENKNGFPLREHFSNLVILKGEFLEIGDKGDGLELKQIFSIIFDSRVTILLRGDRGFGKTTLCKKLAYDWATAVQPDNYLKQFDFVVFIELGKEEETDLNDLILRKVCGTENSEEKEKIKDANLTFLIILDGFDECSFQQSVVNFVTSDSASISKKMMILLTVHGILVEDDLIGMKNRLLDLHNDRFESGICIPEIKFEENMNLVVYIDEFSAVEEEMFVNLVFKQRNDRARNLLNLLKNNSFYAQLADCPMLLHALCCLYRDERVEDIETKTDLFIRLFGSKIERYVKNNEEFSYLKKGKYFYGEDLLVKLGKIIYEKELSVARRERDREIDYVERLKEHNKNISVSEFMQSFTDEKDRKFLLGINILVRCYDVNEDCECYYTFLHQTFREFVIALSFSDSIRIPIQELPDADYYFPSIKFPDSNHITLFYFGLLNDNPIPDQLLSILNEDVQPLTHLIESFNEIKNDANRKLLFSKTKHFVTVESSINCKTFPQQLNRIYFIIEQKVAFEDVRRKLIELQDVYNHSEKLDILIFVHLNYYASLCFRDEENKTFVDIRQSTKLIRRLMRNEEWRKLNIYFCGILDVNLCKPNRVIPIDKTLYDCFVNWTNFENPVEVPESVKNEINSNEELVAFRIQEDDPRSMIFFLADHLADFKNHNINLQQI